ncbi:hypothetical protein BGX28_002452 [Mortierella sp. GBA30]|nr:hypothetical protein BGX28_002452 [Mortierella sp. GBA30]
MDGCTTVAADKNHYVFQCAVKQLSWQAILQKHTTKTNWPDYELNTLLSFDRPQFSVLPEYNISPAQLIACCLVGVSQAINVRYHENLSMSSSAITNSIQREIDRIIAQNNAMK